MQWNVGLTAANPKFGRWFAVRPLYKSPTLLHLGLEHFIVHSGHTELYKSSLLYVAVIVLGEAPLNPHLPVINMWIADLSVASNESWPMAWGCWYCLILYLKVNDGKCLIILFLVNRGQYMIHGRHPLKFDQLLPWSPMVSLVSSRQRRTFSIAERWWMMLSVRPLTSSANISVWMGQHRWRMMNSGLPRCNEKLCKYHQYSWHIHRFHEISSD